MLKKNRRYLIAIGALAVAFLLVLSVNLLIKTGENANNGSETPNGHSEPDGTPVAEENLVFLSKRGYISETGCPTILGEVKNAGNFTMENILITASFYCSKGKLIGAKEEMSAITSGSTEIAVLASGETSPFKIALSAQELAMLPNFDVDKVQKYTVVVSSYNTTEQKLYRSFEISQSRGELNSTDGQYRVAGKVKNAGNETAEQIKIVCTFYDGQPRIIEIVSIYLQYPLLPGDEAQFEVTVLGKTISERVKTFSIQAVAREEG